MMAAQPTQPRLFPDTPSRFLLAEVALEQLPADEGIAGPAPSPALLASVLRDGILQPVLLVRSYGERYLIAEGRRRIKAARAAGLTNIPAWVTEGDIAFAAALGLVSHAVRKDNPAAELESIERLLRLGASEQVIAQETGVRLGTIRQRLRLLGLDVRLREALRAGQVAVGVAEEAAKLPEAAQRRLAEQLASEGKVSAADVDAERRVRTVEAAATLPFALLSATPAAQAAEPASAPAGAASQLLRLLTWALCQQAAEQVQEVVPLEQGGLLVRLRNGDVCTVVVTDVAADRKPA